jgi:hypothetical protein
MTDTPNHDWEHWQVAWRTQPALAATTVAELQRRLLRHRRAAWAYTALDVVGAIAVCAFGAYGLIRKPTLPFVVWAVSVFVFSAIALGFAIWNRRDALFYSAQPTADFVALLRLRLERRERWPRFLVWFVAAEIAFGLIYVAIVRPGALALIAALYAAMALPLGAWWWWHRKRLRRERAQLDALCRDDSDGASSPPTG